jgi:hypothetical protein
VKHHRHGVGKQFFFVVLLISANNRDSLVLVFCDSLLFFRFFPFSFLFFV